MSDPKKESTTAKVGRKRFRIFFRNGKEQDLEASRASPSDSKAMVFYENDGATDWVVATFQWDAVIGFIELRQGQEAAAEDERLSKVFPK